MDDSDEPEEICPSVQLQRENVQATQALYELQVTSNVIAIPY